MRVPITATTAAPAEMRNRFVGPTTQQDGAEGVADDLDGAHRHVERCAPEDERFLGHDVRQQRDGRGEGGVHDGDEHEAHPPRQ